MSNTRMAVAQHTLGGVLAIIGGLLLAVSAFLPSIESTTPWYSSIPPPALDTFNGMDDRVGNFYLVGGDGIFFLVGGALIAALGLWTILSRPKAAPILLILSGLAFGLLGLFEFGGMGSTAR